MLISENKAITFAMYTMDQNNRMKNVHNNIRVIFKRFRVRAIIDICQILSKQVKT